MIVCNIHALIVGFDFECEYTHDCRRNKFNHGECSGKAQRCASLLHSGHKVYRVGIQWDFTQYAVSSKKCTADNANCIMYTKWSWRDELNLSVMCF